jgi:hypothetical protein
LWTRSAKGRTTVGRQLAADEVGKVRAEVARHADFAAISDQIEEVNEKICEARPVSGAGASAGQGDEKKGSGGRLRGRNPPR